MFLPRRGDSRTQWDVQHKGRSARKYEGSNGMGRHRKKQNDCAKIPNVSANVILHSSDNPYPHKHNSESLQNESLCKNEKNQDNKGLQMAALPALGNSSSKRKKHGVSDSKEHISNYNVELCPPVCEYSMDIASQQTMQHLQYPISDNSHNLGTQPTHYHGSRSRNMLRISRNSVCPRKIIDKEFILLSKVHNWPNISENIYIGSVVFEPAYETIEKLWSITLDDTCNTLCEDVLYTLGLVDCDLLLLGSKGYYRISVNNSAIYIGTTWENVLEHCHSQPS